MLTDKQDNSTTDIDFYEDNNTSYLNNSLFGQIKKIFKQVLIDKYYELPKIIVIGTESSGKSSLIERITKCKIFPRDNKLCTKCPIKINLENSNSKKPFEDLSILSPNECKAYSIQLPGNKVQILENKKDIYPIVQKYMNSLPNDIISENEIIINITDCDVPDFVFYVLPKIQRFLQTIPDVSVKICKKYLSDKNSIVLCVVPCTSTRLSFYQSIALIKESKMEHNTIIALTMSDRLEPENIDKFLINRIIDKTDEINGIKFGDCNAIVNFSLDESDELEKKWFNENILKYIPNEYDKFINIIIQNTTISNLLKNIDNLYNNFIQIDWIPRMIEEMSSKEEIIKKEIKTFKPIVTKDSYPELLSLCLNYEQTEMYKNYNRGRRIPVAPPNKYFIGAIPIQPCDFFEVIRLHISINDNNSNKFIFNIPSMDSEVKYLQTGIPQDIDNRGNNMLCDTIEWYNTLFSNFYDRITIVYRLKDTIFNIPVKRFINMRKKFDELFLQYIKKIYNDDVLKILKRNVIDNIINTVYTDTYQPQVYDPCKFFIKLFSKFGYRDKSKYFNDFILQNLTIDYFVESDEKILKLESELKEIQSNISTLKYYAI
jgi:hypothetical protein